MRSVAGKIDWLRAVLFCGVLAPLLCLAADRLAGDQVLLPHVTGGLLIGNAALGGRTRALSIAIPASCVLLAILRFATAASSSTRQAASLTESPRNASWFMASCYGCWSWPSTLFSPAGAGGELLCVCDDVTRRFHGGR